MFKVEYHHLVLKEDIPRLGTFERARIKLAIEEKLFTNPEIFGKPLRASLKGYWKLRVGNYRVVYKILGDMVLVLLIEHRSSAYKKIEKRI